MHCACASAEKIFAVHANEPRKNAKITFQPITLFSSHFSKNPPRPDNQMIVSNHTRIFHCACDDGEKCKEIFADPSALIRASSEELSEMGWKKLYLTELVEKIELTGAHYAWLELMGSVRTKRTGGTRRGDNAIDRVALELLAKSSYFKICWIAEEGNECASTLSLRLDADVWRYVNMRVKHSGNPVSPVARVSPSSPACPVADRCSFQAWTFYFL